MAEGNDNYIDQLIREIGGLFGQNDTPNKPAPHASLSEKYTAPIHGTWHNSGGFDLSMRRADGRIGHQGVDLRAPGGTPIYSFGPGVVTGVGTDPLGGNVINIQHPDGLRTYYAHLSTVVVHKGDKVDSNTVIGTVGNTGDAAGAFPHLHFQIWKDGHITNPASFFPVPKYSDLSAEEKQHGPWLSDDAKHQAQSFNMKNYLSQQRIAFSQNIDSLLKIAHQYEKVVRLLNFR